MDQLRVLVADDNERLRTAYKDILETEDGIEVVGMASDGQEALEESIDLAPDVVVLDVRMPYMDGLAAANRMMAHDSRPAIVLVSAYEELAFVRALMHSDASRKAYLLKSSLDDHSEFIRVVKAVAKGQAVLHGNMVQRLLSTYHLMNAYQAKPLTESEEGVLKFMLEGYSESEIAQRLPLPFEQAGAVITSLCVKLRVVKRGDLSRSPQVVRAMVNLCVP
ncbi:MAG: response regulator transcription factor [Chloroflexi bacterium]|nr:response regulator transcription factor [Chloroflexota bacterium]